LQLGKLRGIAINNSSVAAQKETPPTFSADVPVNKGRVEPIDSGELLLLIQSIRQEPIVADGVAMFRDLEADPTAIGQLAAPEGVSEEEWRRTLELMGGFGTDADMVSGPYVKLLRSQTLHFLGADVELVRGIPVVLLPSQNLNGFAFQTKSRHTAIALDSMTLIISHALVAGLSGMVSSVSGTPLCRHYAHADFSTSLIGLARFCVTGSSYELPKIAPAMCPCLVLQPELENLRILLKSFILLHEYAHVLLGHLDDNSLRQHQLPGSKSINVYRRSREMEFEADDFALAKLIAAAPKNQREAACAAPIILMCFLDLAESFFGQQPQSRLEETHPRAIDRANRLLERGRVGTAAAVAQLPKIFAGLKGGPKSFR
jgi:hypothetical protein